MDEQLSDWSEPLMHWLLAWTLVNLLVAAAVMSLRPRRAVVRYSGWLLATFSGMILVPFVWGLNPVVSWEQVTATFQESKGSEETPRLKQFDYWMSPSDQEIAELTPTLFEKIATPAASGPVETLQTVSAEKSDPGKTVRNTSSVWIIKYIAGLWLAGFIFHLVRLAKSFVQLRRMVSECREPGSVLNAEFIAVQQVLSISRRIPLRVHPGILTPICLGGFRPAVLWPSSENDHMSPIQRRGALVHELGHLGRYDDRINLAAEVWRAFCWFYIPIHLTIIRLRREQEYLCDDLAASHFGKPGEYAQLLLDLSPIRIRDNTLCSSFIGSTAKHRIRRLLSAEFRYPAPIKRGQAIAMMLVAGIIILGAGSVRLVGNVNRADAAEPNDSLLPDVTPRQLAKKVRESFNMYKKGYLEATFEDERDANGFASGEDQQSVMVKIPGRFRYASDGELWRAEFDSQSYNIGEAKLYPRKWSAGFDGDRQYAWRQPHGGFVLGTWQAHEGIPLPEFFWSSHGESFSKSLAQSEKQWKLSNQEIIGGYRCYVLTREATYDTYKARYELTLSPRQSHLPVRYKVFTNGKLGWSYELLDLEKTKNGIWFPRRVRRIDPSWKRKYIAKISRFESEGKFADGYFDVKIPLGVHVRDYRTGGIYLNDPWWPEVKPILRELFDWPPADITSLRDLASFADPEIEGKPAPPITSQTWINGDPITLKQRRGKVTLLYFSSGSLADPNVKWASALKHLYKIYRPAGLEVIGINSSTNNTEENVRNLEDIQIPWSVAVDAAQDGKGYGRTHQSYGLKHHLSPILIDHEGKVHLIKSGKIIEEIKRLLRASGAKDIPDASLDFVQEPREISKLLNEAWHTWVRRAPKTSRIRGKVTDANGPVPNVKITGQLRLETAGSAHSVYATTLYKFRDFNFRCTSGQDGAFELKGLCKGVYIVKIKHPGRKEVEHRVIVPAADKVISLDVKLDSK